MKNYFPILILSFLFGCSSPSGDGEKENINYDSTITPIHQPTIQQFDTVSQPSEDLKKFLVKAKKLYFIPTDTANKFRASDHKMYFGMINVPKEFNDYPRSAMLRAKNACLDLINKKSVHVKVEEWTFENEADAKQVDDALGVPLENKRMERFVRTPFTFFRVHDRMYYVHTDNEQDRKEMDKLSNLLIKLLSPDQ